MSYSLQDTDRYVPSGALGNFLAAFGPVRLQEYREAMRGKRLSSFRLNPLLTNRQECIEQLKSSGIKFREFSAIPHAFQLDSPEGELKKTESYKQGKIYLQGLSGMLPPLFLNPRPGMKVLDLAASPGSKTTMLGALMQNQGEIHAIEPDFIRMERLKFNCAQLNISNVVFHQAWAEKFKVPEGLEFDAILADVPCSGEGRFNLFDSSSYKFWRDNDPDKFSRLQYKMLAHAVPLLKSGGTLVYSTCTLNRVENEGTLQRLLQDFPLMESIDIPALKALPQEFELGNSEGLKFLRIFPSRRFEGFFIALLRKR